MSWQVEYAEGVWLPQVGWWLDARHARERSFVSHAHFDHLALHREILCSPGTARLMRARLPGERMIARIAGGTSTWETRAEKLRSPSWAASFARRSSRST